MPSKKITDSSVFAVDIALQEHQTVHHHMQRREIIAFYSFFFLCRNCCLTKSEQHEQSQNVINRTKCPGTISLNGQHHRKAFHEYFISKKKKLKTNLFRLPENDLVWVCVCVRALNSWQITAGKASHSMQIKFRRETQTYHSMPQRSTLRSFIYYYLLKHLFE